MNDNRFYNKKWFQALLVLTALLVWGYNGINFRKSVLSGLVSASDEAGQNNDAQRLPVISDSIRNPFFHKVKTSQIAKAKPVQPVNEKPIELPPMTLNGIFYESKNPMAIINSNAVHPGEKVGDVLIKAITETTVEVE